MRYFTPDSACRLLPLLRRIAQDLIEVQAELRNWDFLMLTLSKEQRGLGTPAPHAEELAEMRASLQASKQRMSEIDAELASLGVLVHVPAAGALDFPARLEERDVRLCWMPGDLSVSHWHELGEAIGCRRPISGHHFSTDQNPVESPAKA